MATGSKFLLFGGLHKMNYKLLVLTMLLLLSISGVSATYDLQVTSVSVTGSLTEGSMQNVEVALTNAGPDNIIAETIDIEIDFGDTTTTNLVLNNLNAGQSTTLNALNSWTTGGTFTVTATASGMINDSQNANDEASQSVTINGAPNITTINAQTATVGQQFSLQVAATDVNNDPLTYSLSGQPTGMTINANGLITWTPTATTSTSVSVSVSDGSLSSTESFSIAAFNPGASLSTSANTIKLGSSSATRGTQVTQTFTVQNTGSETITNLAASPLTTGGAALASNYNAQVTVSQATLQSGESATITAILTIPATANSRESTIGKVEVTGQGNSIQITESVFMTMQAESKLIIKDVELEVNGDDEGDLDNGDNYDELKEGDEIKLTITIENDYNTNTEIQDVYIEVEDDNWDIDEESDEEDINDGDEEEFEITFTLDDDLDDDTTDVVIRVFGEDEDNGFEHYDEIEFELEVEREDDEILIRSITWNNQPVSCLDSFATMSVRFKNTGTDDQDEAAIVVRSDDFSWYRRITDIELDEGDSETQEFRIPVRGTLDEGNYFVEVSTYYRNDRQTDEEITNLEVVCANTNDNSNSGSTNTDANSGSTSNPNTGSGDSIVLNPIGTPGNTNTVTNPGQAQPIYGEPVTAQLRDNNNYTIALGIIVFILLVAVLIILTKVLRK